MKLDYISPLADRDFNYCIPPNYRTVHLVFQTYWEHSFVVKYVPTKGTL